MDESVSKSIEVLSNRPANEYLIHKFRGNAENLKNLEDAYKSSVFGGSIFLPVGSSKKQNEKRDKQNNLKREVETTHIEYLHGGGYYVLHNVKVSRETDQQNSDEADLYQDIYIMIPSVENMQDLKKLHIQRYESVATNPITDKKNDKKKAQKKQASQQH